MFLLFQEKKVIEFVPVKIVMVYLNLVIYNTKSGHIWVN